MTEAAQIESVLLDTICDNMAMNIQLIVFV